MCMSERGEALSVRELRETAVVRRSSYCFLVLPFGADSISEEVEGFSHLWFHRGKFFVALVSCVVLMFYCCACYSLS